MKKNGLGWIWVLLMTALCICLCFFGTLWMLENCLVVGFHIYPKHAQMLDLRDQSLSTDEYRNLSHLLPETKILWNVPVGENAFSCDAEEITITALSESDISNLKYIPGLKTVHAEDCVDYAALAALREEFPECEVLYRVTVGNATYDWDAVSVAVPNLDEAQVALMEYLPNLCSVDVSGSTDFDLIRRLQDEKPEWNITYCVPMGGVMMSVEETEGQIYGATYADVWESIPNLPKLKELTIVEPEASVEELLQLRQDFPEVEIHWQMLVFDQVITDETRELDLSEIPLEGVWEAEAAADLCPRLEKLIMSDCGIDNETMAAFRERKRDSYKVVWTIHFTSKCSARTDAEYFMPLKQHENYFEEKNVHDLMYCEDMVTIDLGHHKIKTIDFVRYMPHLKFLILMGTEVRDISPISECKELVYLELTQGVVMDFTPLLGCTALEDLNIDEMINRPKLDPIKQMTWLKNLWMRGWKVNLVTLREQMPDTNISAQHRDENGVKWRELPNYYQQRDNLDMPYMD